MLHDAGVELRAGSDSLDPYVFPGESLHRELELLVQAGLSPYDALDAATVEIGSSQASLIAVRLPSGETGYESSSWIQQADAVLLDADPIADIRNTRQISAVVVGGKLYRKQELEQMRSDVQKSFAQMDGKK
jgi:imidazolonepropionase-like amidohydrolase